MSYELKNTADDRSKVHLHRIASKLVMEPVICDRRLKLRDTMTVSDEYFESHKDQLKGLETKGVIEIKHVGAVPVPVVVPSSAIVPPPVELSNQESGAAVSLPTQESSVVKEPEAPPTEEPAKVSKTGPGKKKFF
jgi:hypothetical protein